MFFRGYRESEFDFACQLRGISDVMAKNEYRPRFLATGNWQDHYLDYVVDVEGKPVGEVQLRHCTKTMPDGVLEFGIEIAPEFQSMGYGSAATSAITQMMFDQGYHRISGSTDSENLAMQRVFEKAGWVLEGTLYALFLLDGKPRNYLSYSRTVLSVSSQSRL